MLSYLALACAGLIGATPAHAQVTADGTTVPLTPATATCSAPICFEALNGGTINSSGNAVNVTVPDDPNFPPSSYGAYAHNGGTINLLDGGTISIGASVVGLSAGRGGTGGAITATGLTIIGQNADNFAASAGATGSIVFNGTTHLQGSVQEAIFSQDLSVITFNGPVQANLSGLSFASVITGGRLELNGGGNVTFNGSGLFGTGNNRPPVGTSTITMTGLIATLTGTGGDAALFSTSGDQQEITATNSAISGTNAGGQLYGIDTELAGTTSVTLDGSSLTLNSAGSAIRVRGNTTTVNLLNGATITPFASGANNSLAEITNYTGLGPGYDGPGNLTLNAANSTLSGNVLVDAPGAAGANAFAANLSGTTQWDGNLTVNGASTADVSLSGTAQWTGMATNATNIGVGSGATWNVTGDSTLSGTLTNGGTIAFAADGPFKTITTPNYVGNGGAMTFNTALGTDNSPTDQLIINGGTGTGSTNVTINNKGGAGGTTSGNGIQIIAAQNGATTSSSSFTLGGPVVAGLSQYYLFRGPLSGGTADEQNSWYLRSHIDNGPNPPIPIYRPEGAMFASMPSLGRELTRNTIGTFHDYNGDQGLIRGNGAPGRAWGRVFGESIEQGHAGLLSPNFKGHAYGFQTGVDLFESETPSGFKDRFGVFFGYAQAKGEVRGFALGVQNHYVGDSSLEGLSGGAYWTRVGPRDEYLEARILGTRYTGDGTSFANHLNIDVKGTSFAASLEGGMPIRFGFLTIEPQAQLIYQYLDMTGSDPLSKIAYDTPDALYARVGLRLSSDGLFGWSNVRPYVKANLWHDAVGADKAIFSPTDVVETSFRATALEVGGGVVAQLTQYVGLWGMMDYTTDVSGNQERQIVRGNAGVRIVW